MRSWRREDGGKIQNKMNVKAPNKLLELIQAWARMIKDPADREIQILEDAHTLRIASESGRTVPEVYSTALSYGIYPYRYIRNRDSISAEEQFRLAQSRVAVAGAGGLGGQVILLLARIGLGHLTVIDYDFFEESNLNRQSLSNEERLGRPKAQGAVDAVGSINPGVEVIPFRTVLNPLNAPEILAGADVVIDALDNIPDKFVLEKAAKKLGIPLVHGALAGFEGRLMTIFPNDPGLREIYGEQKAERDNEKMPEDLLGVPAPMPSVIASFQAMEVIKIILKKENLFRNVLLQLDLERGLINKFTLKTGY